MADKPLPLLVGGVMRCCINTYEGIAPPAEHTAEGDTLPCSYCDSRLIVHAGMWGWDRQYDLERLNQR